MKSLSSAVDITPCCSNREQETENGTLKSYSCTISILLYMDRSLVDLIGLSYQRLIDANLLSHCKY